MTIALMLKHSFFTYLTWLLISFLFCGSDGLESCGQNGQSCRYGQTSCVNNKCLYGCEPGWTGNSCHDSCYINHCLECVHTSGPGHPHSQKCTHCEPGFYGESCEKVCSENCLFGSSRCSREGNCLYGCKPNYQGYKCETPFCDIQNCKLCKTVYGHHYCHVCNDGMFWSPYYSRCVDCTGKCVGGSQTCNTTTGFCPKGCQTGWFGASCDLNCTIPQCIKCQEYGYQRLSRCVDCEKGWYKKDGVCEACSDYCVGGVDSCNNNTGYCTNGCTLGWYGNNCKKKCMLDNCKVCKETPFGDVYCKECEKGWFWHYSNSTCIPCTDRCLGGREACNVTNGLCLNGCAENYYGIHCQWTCSSNCVNGTCDSVTGSCDHGCTEGWYGPRCDRRCPLHCRRCADFIDGVCGDCEAGTYGVQCEKKCSNNCKRSDYNNYIYCEKNSGKCVYGCVGGYYGDSCNNPCSQNCYNGICEQSTGFCNTGCNSVWYGKKCDRRCPAQCYNSQSANSRQCHQLTGLCVYGCRKGYFGESCERSCSKRCKLKACDRYSGYCTQGCEPGYHGENCTKACNENCENYTCYQKNGHCVKCQEGFFGEFCKYDCLPNCLSTCDKNSGFCKACKNGYYGSRCNQDCVNCYNNTCDQYTGKCKLGCREGMTGEDCLESCSPGHYGQDCSQTCGQCKDNTPCDMKSGECQLGCDVGWTGSTCQDSVKVAGEIKQQHNNYGTVAATGGAIGGALLIIVVIVVIVLIIRHRKNFIFCTKKRSDTISSQTFVPDRQIQLVATEMETIPEVACQTHDWKINPSDLQIQHSLIFDGQFYDLAKGTLKRSDVENSDCQVTVKIFHKNSNQTLKQNFYHEIKILKTLRHQSNIMEFICMTETEDDVYSIFDKNTSTDLLRYLHNLRGSSAELPSVIVQGCMKELLNYSLEVVTGLSFLHESSIIHGCMAAVNIFIDENFTAKIGNFYYSSVCNDRGDREKSEERPTEQFVGWMPPELLKNTVKSFECDMWSFGVLLWEVFTLGDIPYDRDDNETKARRIIEGGKLPKPDGCKSKIYRAMSRCWIDFPSQRPSAEQLIGDFKRLLSYTDLMDDSIMNTVTTVV